MPRSVDLYLSDLLQASDNVLGFTDGLEFSAYESNAMLRAAVERMFTIIGEGMRQLGQHYPEYLHGILGARKIVDFRNLVVHQYASVDDEEVWSAVRSKLPGFRDQIAALLEARRLPG